MRIGKFVGYRDVNFGAMILGNHAFQVQPRRSGEDHRRAACPFIYGAKVAPIDAAGKTRSKRLRAGLLGRKALGVGCSPHQPPIRFPALNLSEYPGSEAGSEPVESPLDSPDVYHVTANADDHGLWSRARERSPRSQAIPSAALVGIHKRPGAEIGGYGHSYTHYEAAQHHGQEYRSQERPQFARDVNRIGNEIAPGKLRALKNEILADFLADQQHADLIIANHHQRTHERIADERANRCGNEAGAEQPADNSCNDEMKADQRVESHEHARSQAKRDAVRGRTDAAYTVPYIPRRALETQTGPKQSEELADQALLVSALEHYLRFRLPGLKAGTAASSGGSLSAA